MLKVRWVMLHEFCSKFHKLFSSANSYIEFKSGNFFETQCILPVQRHMYTELTLFTSLACYSE